MWPCLSGASGVQCVAGESSSTTLRGVVEELVHFRLKVRQLALATPETGGEARRPLLEACDELRRNLAAHGISIKVSLGPAAGVRGSAGRTRPCLRARTHAHTHTHRGAPVLWQGGIYE